MNAQLHDTSGQEIAIESCVTEAAQYALLRRLAPVIRHNMAGTLQPIAMVAAMLERRLQKADADMDALLRNARDIIALSKEAAASCIDLMGWLAPRETRSIQASEGITECLGMVATQLSFKGFSIADHSSETGAEISQSASRNVLTAALLALTDVAAPSVLRIETEFTQDFFSVRVSLGELTPPTSTRPPESSPYRRLEWKDVEALAARESVRLMHTDKQVELFFAASMTSAKQVAETAQA
ncbi:MAG: hypothetical protein ABI893_04885 [Polaromonas sp.]|uniref:hypothetical protein n=1 Tax=Polaromonas sp. TaxID=1869339 RepID=UPI00326752C4